MSSTLWAWGLFSIYLVVTAFLAWRGGQKGGDATTFAIGSGRMSPLIAGMTLGASLASSAMFVIFPGFVYKDGLAPLIGFSVPLIAGLGLGFALLGPRFQSLGAQGGALTVPHWLGARYADPRLRRLFSALNVLNIAYLVLIAVGCGYVMQATLGVPYIPAVIGVVVFVFGYTGFGGAWAHALTNTLQGAIMLVVALVLFGTGLGTWADGRLWADLSSTGAVAPGTALFGSAAEVWLVPFLMGMALSTQPHLLTKSLYVEDRAAWRQTVGIGMGTYAVFSLVLFVGAYARLALPAGIPQDQAVAQYIQAAVPWGPVNAVVGVAILSASMSTMDGLLVAISASVANDLLPGRGSVAANRLVLVGLAVATIAVAVSPPPLVLILGQQGVYGLVAASAGPLVAGLFLRGPLASGPAIASAIAALAVHFGLTAAGVSANPGVTASAAVAVGLPIALLPPLLRRSNPAAVGLRG